MTRHKLYILAALLVGLLSMSGAYLGDQPASALTKDQVSGVEVSGPEVSTAVKFDVSPPLTELIAKQPATKDKGLIREIPEGPAGATPTPTPTITATPCGFTTLLNEGFEGGTLGAFASTAFITSTTTPVPTPGWASVASNPHSGTRSAFAPDPDRTTDSRLTTLNNTVIPSGVSAATLTFWHRFAFENTFDGGVLEVSTNGGTSWNDADPNIQQGGYNGTITIFNGCVTAGTPPPFPAGKRVWTGSSTTYSQVRVNLLPYVGTNMKFRFRLGTDCSVSNTGWNIDDVVVSYSGDCSTATHTATATPTDTPSTPLVTPTECAITFSDVLPTDYFYEPVLYMFCRGIISGYGDNTFRPFNFTTRAQMVKIVVLGFEIPISKNTMPTFEDVPTSNVFFPFVETAAENAIVAGYGCGGPGEPCVPPDNRPYFRPNNLVTRGQLSKITVVAALWQTISPKTPTFADVPPTNTFYTFIETAYCHQIISGYACGGPGEPCPGLYFRPFANATRGQISKIVYLGILDEAGCVTSPAGSTR